MSSGAIMRRTVPFVSLALALVVAHPVLARDAREVSWAELAPAAVDYENPFEGLGGDQLDGLRRLLRLQPRVESGDADAAADAAALRAELTASGLDVDGLLAKRLEIMALRRAAATGVNESLVGEKVRIPGYVVPLEFADQKAVEFLLVPTAGACIHTPPPPANQLLHVRYPEGVEVKGLSDAVWVEGRIEAQHSVRGVRYVDGDASVESSYSMQPALVEPYR
jgi:hypothetical protein